MAKTNREYWRERFQELEEKAYLSEVEYVDKVQKQFEKAIREMELELSRWYMRIADQNEISYAAAKQLLTKGELAEFQWTVKEYIKYGEENAVHQQWMKQLEHASAKYHISRLEAQKIQLQQCAEKLSVKLAQDLGEHLGQVFLGQYGHVAFEVAKGIGVGSPLFRMDERKLDAIIKRPWAMDGKNFSDRIWGQKEKLIQNLHIKLTQNLIRGIDPQPSINRLAKTMQVSKQQAGSLIMTESAAIASTAQKKCFEDLEVEEYEIVATLDSRTSKLCQGLNGKVFKRKDYQVGETAPPFHPRCRTCTCPYFSDEFTIGEERAASDENGNMVYVPTDMTYEEWEKQFVTDPALEREKQSKRRESFAVNWDVVKAKGYRDKFKHISNSKVVQETLFQKAMDILKHRSGTDYEDFYLIDCQKGNVVASQTKVEYTKGISEEGKHNRVWYNGEIAKAIRKYSKNSFVTIHNHAGSNPPSGGDFEGAFVNGYFAGINVCHNGDLYYYKVGKKVFSGKLYDMTIDKYKARGYNELAAYEATLDQFRDEYGIEWEKL